jgi:hypothetical protein
MKEDEVGRLCSTYKVRRNRYKVLVGKPEEKKTSWKT